MKKRLIMACCMLASTIICLSQDIPPANEGKAVVYFVRTSSLGAAINFTYFDSATVIAKTNGPNYVRYECEPGVHLFWARSENRDFIEADLEAGKIYFLQAVPEMGAIKAQVSLRPVDPSEEKTMKRIFKLMSKKPAETFTADELAKETRDFKDVIARGLEKYKEDKQNGKEVDKLEKTAFYAMPATNK